MHPAYKTCFSKENSDLVNHNVNVHMRKLKTVNLGKLIKRNVNY